MNLNGKKLGPAALTILAYYSRPGADVDRYAGAKACNLHPNTFSRIVNELEGMGLLATERKRTTKPGPRGITKVTVFPEQTAA